MNVNERGRARAGDEVELCAAAQRAPPLTWSALPLPRSKPCTALHTHPLNTRPSAERNAPSLPAAQRTLPSPALSLGWVWLWWVKA